MRPREICATGAADLFRSRLDQIIDMRHALVKLSGVIDWRFLEERFGAAYTDLIAHQRYAHAKQFKRANKALKALRTLLGRVIPAIDDLQRRPMLK